MRNEEARQIIEKLQRDKLPGNRLPTVEELLRACECPEKADPQLLRYLAKRPEYRQFLEASLHPERWLDSEQRESVHGSGETTASG